ncbi:hypothetical protein BDF22DRAFT_687453 [Syncephalis plumigaleata]|nr:hypothetical protein BDF22DRAFT_687453 [Syncephalis plumigaleata]
MTAMLKHTARRTFSISARTAVERPSNSLASVFKSPRVETSKAKNEEKTPPKESPKEVPKTTQTTQAAPPTIKKSLATTGLLARLREIKQTNKSNNANAQNTISEQLLDSLETTLIPESVVSKKSSIPSKPSQSAVMNEDEKREMKAWKSVIATTGGKWAKVSQPTVEELAKPSTANESKQTSGTPTLENRLKDRAQLVNAAKMPIPVQQMRVEAVDLESPFAIPSLRELMAKARVESEKHTTSNSTEVARQNAMEQYGGDYQRYSSSAIKQLAPEAAATLSRNVTYTLLQRANLADAVHQLSSR